MMKKASKKKKKMAGKRTWHCISDGKEEYTKIKTLKTGANGEQILI